MKGFLRSKLVLSLATLIMIAAAIAVSLVSSTSRSHAAFPGGKGDIVFTSDRGNISEIYKVSANGGAQTRLTDPQTQSANDEPKWSPDGNRIAFTSYRDGEPQVYVMNADGTGQTRLTGTGVGNNYEPSWSPDGKRILFISDRDGTGQVYVMNSDGTGQTRLTDGDTNTHNRTPAWSPDGRKIAFVSSTDSNPDEIWVMNVDGTAATQLTTAPAVGNGTNFEPAWSPDGTKIVYTSMLPARQVADWEIWAMNADGSDQNPLTLADDRVFGDPYTSDGANWLPAYSPDGTQVVFETYRNPGGVPTGYTLWIMNADGSEQHSLIDSPGGSYRNYQADWQPVVAAPPPVVKPTASFSTTVHPGGQVDFDATASTPGSPSSPITGYEWTFGDSSGLTTATPKTEHTFKDPKTFTATLVVIDSNGNRSLPVSKPIDTCAPDLPAFTGVEFAGLVACVEAKLPGESPRQILSTMRQFYYGDQAWSQRRDPNWNAVITCGQSVPDPTPSLGPKLVSALIVAQAKGEDKRPSIADVDVGHLFTGLEAMECPSSKVVFHPIAGLPALYWTVNMPNYFLATWGGDIGSAAATKAWDDRYGTASYPWSHYIGPNGNRAGDDDLNGDVDAFSLHYAEGVQSSCGTPLTPLGPQAWSTPLSQLLRDYYGVDSGGYHQRRMQCFKQVLGLDATNAAALSRQMTGKYQEQVYDFAISYFAKQKYGSDVLLHLVRKTLRDNSRAVLGIFAAWISAQA